MLKSVLVQHAEKYQSSKMLFKLENPMHLI